MITYGFYVIIHLAIAIAILMLIAQMMGGRYYETKWKP